MFSWVWCKTYGCSFFCVYMKIISGGPFIDFVKIWLNELLGLRVFGLRCCDCYVITLCCDFVHLLSEWNARGVNVR